MTTMKDYQTCSDAEIAQAIRLSDEVAFKTLYFRYYEPLHRFLWYRLRSTEQASDYLQEVFMRFWEHRSRLDPSRSVKSYLYRIAHNLVIDHLRKASSVRAYRLELLKRDVAAEEDLDAKISIRSAVEDLPERLRTVFILSRYQGLKYAEIAEICRISVKTVESRMSKALGRLRQVLR